VTHTQSHGGLSQLQGHTHCYRHHCCCSVFHAAHNTGISVVQICLHSISIIYYIFKLYFKYFSQLLCKSSTKYKIHLAAVITRRHVIAESTARCSCKFRYISKLSAASRGFHCDSNAFELNNSINHGKITVFNIYLLPLNSLFNSHCLPPLKMLKLYIVRRYVSLYIICLA